MYPSGIETLRRLVLMTIKPCGKAAPPHWGTTEGGCVLPEGHEIKFEYTPVWKLKKVVVGTGHKLADGRQWPVGQYNIDFV